MSLISILSGIVTIAKAIPYISMAIDKLTELWIDEQVKDLDVVLNEKKSKRKALMKAIGNAKTDEERKALASILNDYNSSKL